MLHMKLSQKDIAHIASLARLSCTEAELCQFEKEFEGLLKEFDTLSSIDTEGVPPTTTVAAYGTTLRSEKPLEPKKAGDIISESAHPLSGNCISIVKTV